MAQRLARSYFFYHSVFSHQKLSIGWQVVSRQFQLSRLSTLLVKGSLSHSFALFASLLCNIDCTLKPWQLQNWRGRKKINHSLSQIRSCGAHDKVNRTVIHFIFASCHRCHWHAHPSFPITWFYTQKSHTQTNAHYTGSWCLYSTCWWIDLSFFFFY